MWQSATVISLLSLLLFVTAGRAQQLEDTSCPSTPKQEIVSAVAPAAGAYPVWVVDGSFGRWSGPDAAVKTAWILARDNPGDLTVVGKRVDGDGRVMFRLAGTADLSDRLVIANADTLQIVPGGIEPDELRRYSFRVSGLVYPSAGCWELLVHYGTFESRIVVGITDQT